MKCRSLLVLSAFLVAGGCKDARQSIGPRAPDGPAEIISDGSHGGNADFFFLPPMVPPPFQDPDFDAGQFNPRLQASLKIEICTLDSNLLSPEGKPLSTTPCVGPLIKTFAPGSVDLVGVPSQQSGWWSNFNLPSDGFYKVLWDTRQHELALDKYYRIKVLLDGSDVPLGYADVDPVSNMREWRHAVTGEVVTMIDDSKLPIVFRVEKGALCEGATQCGSATITNDNPNGDTQLLQVLNEDGVPVAGVLIPDGWLPPDGPQSVVFSIARVNTGVNNVAAGTQQFPCHANLQMQQFDGCFHFSTIPELPVIDEETGRQFATPIIGAVCFVLNDTEDPREPFAQLWSSEPGEEGDQPIPLKSADASGILTAHDGANCGGTQEPVADNTSNLLTRFASAGWQKVTSGLGRVFGVKTAYAVDLGLGGILDGISNIGPAVSAQLQQYTPTELELGPGATTTATVRIVGTQKHDGSALTTGIGGMQVTYTLAAANHGELKLIGSEGAGSSSVTVSTNTNPINPESPTSGGGFAPVNWTMPTAPGTYTLTATSPSAAGSVTFTFTVPEPAVALGVLAGNWINENVQTGGNPRVQISVDGNDVFVHAWGACSPTLCDWGPTTASTTRWASDQEITAVWDQSFVISTLTITSLPDGRLSIVNHYDFIPPDTRVDFTSPAEFFSREVVTGVDQSHTGPMNLSALINECCRYVAQVFIPAVTGTLAGVNVEVASTSTHSLNVAIRTTDNGVPTQTILGATTLTTGGSSLSELITFPQTITLTAGVPYAIVVSYPTAPAPGAGQAQGQWVGSTGELYPRGYMYTSVDGTSWFMSGGTGADGLFRTHMSVPTP